MRLLLAVEPVDFRKGIDDLAQVCRLALEKDLFSGYVFIFRNKKASCKWRCKSGVGGGLKV